MTDSPPLPSIPSSRCVTEYQWRGGNDQNLYNRVKNSSKCSHFAIHEKGEIRTDYIFQYAPLPSLSSHMLGFVFCWASSAVKETVDVIMVLLNFVKSSCFKQNYMAGCESAVNIRSVQVRSKQLLNTHSIKENT